jgi:hypothetical protein
MKNRRVCSLFVLVITIGVLLSFAQSSYSATTIDIFAVGPLADIGGIQFDIITPPEASSTDFTPLGAVTSWLNFSSGDTVQYFDGVGSNSLMTGDIGTFTAYDVTLDGWVLSDQSANVLQQGVDYIIVPNGTNYTVNPVPIPPTVLLLGAGLMGLVGIRRRVKS